MKKFNKLAITGVIMAILVMLMTTTFIVFAAFRFSKTVEEDDSIIGGVEINSRSIVSYQQTYTVPDSSAGFNAEFFRKCKLRTDSVCNVEGLRVTKDANNNVKISDSRATAYNSANAVVTTNTIANDTKLQLTSTTSGASFDMVLSFTFNTPANESPTIATATIDSGGSNYEVVVGMDGLSLFIFA